VASEGYNRLHRLLWILMVIKAKRGWNAEALARQCGTTARSIYRDLNELKALGIVIDHDPVTEGYIVQGDVFLPPLSLNPDEALALAALAEHVGGAEQIPFTAAAARALDKIRGQLPASVQEELQQLDGQVQLQLAKASSDDGIHDVYQLVREAIASRRALACRYEPPTPRCDPARAAETFTFHPYRLFFCKRAWYAVGYHAGRDAVRSLKLQRFTRIDSTEKPYAIPEDFSLEAHLGLAWQMIPGQQRYHVSLRFDPAFAETIADTHWHSTQQLEWLEDESIRFQCQVDGLEEIVWWVLSMGPHCEVESPPELAGRVRDLARRTAGLYGRAQPET